MTHRTLVAMRLAGAVLAPFAIAAVVQLTWPFFAQAPASIFLIAVVFSAWYGGLKAGLLSLIISVLVADFLFIHPYLAFGPFGRADAVYLITLVVVGILVSSLIDKMQHAKQLAEGKLESTRANELRFRMAVEASPSAMLMIDDQGRIVLVNQQTEKLFGYERADLLGQPIELLVPERYRTNHPAYRFEFHENPSARPMGAGRELFGRRKDGSEVPVEIGLNPLQTEEGSFVLASIIDITERNRAEEQFRLVVEAAPNGMLMINARGVITLVNAQAERLFGYARAELLGLPIETLVPERFRASHPRLRTGFFTHPSTRPMGAGRDLYGRRKDGSEVPIEIGLNPIETGNESFVLASIIDITERKRAEERFRLVVEAAPSAMLMVNEKGLITLVNRQTERLFGYDRDELVDRPVEVLVPERYRAFHPGHRGTFAQNPTARAMGAGRDLFGLRKDGTEVPIEIGLNPIRTDEGAFVLASIIDISERKRAEEALRNSEERLHTVIENLSEGLVISDLNGQLLHWNRTGLEMFGFKSMEECLLTLPEFQNVFELSTLDGTVVALDRWPLSRIIAGEHLVNYELHVRRIDSDWERIFSYGGTIISEPNGQELAFVTIMDVTESKQAEEKLRRSREQLTGIIGSAMDAIISVDDQQRIILFNNAAERMFLFPAEDAIGQPLDRFIPERFRAGHKQHIERFGETQVTRRSMGALGNLYGLRADGEEFPIEASISQIETGGETVYTVILRDMTERQRTEEALKEQARMLDLAPVLIRDLNDRVIFWNTGAQQMYGWKAEEALGKVTHSLFKTEHPRPIEELKARLYARNSWEGVLVHTRKDGQKIVVASHWVLHRDEQGKPKAILEVNNDITERKLAEEQSTRLATAVEQSGDSIIITDTKGNISYVNPAFEQTTGYTSAEVMGTNPRFLKGGEAGGEYYEELWQTITSGQRWTGHFTNKRKDGSLFEEEATISPVRDRVGNIVNYVAVKRDITERKRNEEMIVRLAGIVESSNDAILSKTLDGVITSWNKGAERLYGYTEAEVTGRSVSMLMPPDKKGELSLILGKLRRGERIKNFETTRLKKSGEQIEVSLTISTIKNSSGAIIGASTIARDITARKRAEEQIRKLNEELEQRVADRTAQLQAANKELEAFSYSVSHDLRAPLRHINGFSQALMEDYADQLDVGGKHYLQEVRDASQEMAQLIDDVLQLARVTRSEMRQEEVSLSDLASSVIADLKKSDRERDVKVDIENGLAARGDKRLLRIVLTNLLGNAWKFTSRKTDPEIRFGSEKRNGETLYFVRDNGAGFDMAYANKLFGAFQRLHTSDQFEGTGIGLATVQRIVHRHGGRVTAEGKLDEGATFYFTLSNPKENGDARQSDPTG